jgi:hypothetical protein
MSTSALAIWDPIEEGKKIIVNHGSSPKPARKAVEINGSFCLQGRTVAIAAQPQ